MKSVCFASIPVLLAMAAAVPLRAENLPAPFETCQLVDSKSVAAGEKAIAISRSFNGCFSLSGKDYGRVFVQFTPPSGVDGNGLEPKQRRNLLKAIRAFFTPEIQSGAIVLVLTLKREGVPAIPLDAMVLASFDLSEQNGLHLSDNQQKISSRVGYRYKLGGDAKIEASVFFLRSKSNVGLISQKLNAIRSRFDPIGYLSTGFGNDLLNALPDIEAEILSQFSIDEKRRRTIPLDYADGGFQVAELEVGIGPSTATRGVLRIGLQRIDSILVDDLKPTTDGSYDFHITHYGPDEASDVTGRFIMGVTLRDQMIKLMGAAGFTDLTSSDPAKFEAACNLLGEKVQSQELGFNGRDQALTRWALLASNANMTMAAIRNTPCLKALETANLFSRYSLPMPPVAAPPLPAAYQTIVSDAEQQVSLVTPRIARAVTQAAAAEAASAKLEQQDHEPGYGPLDYAGFKYRGQLLQSGGHVVGVYVTTDPGQAGNRYAGEIEMPTVVPQFVGSGIYHYADSDGQHRTTYIGDFQGGRPNGYGQLSWADGRVFIGRFVNGTPSGNGLLIWPDGRRQYGLFDQGQLTSSGVERQASGSYRAGYWAAGTLIVPAAL